MDIKDLIKNAVEDKPADLKTTFVELMKDKLRQELEAKRDQITNTLYNDENEYPDFDDPEEEYDEQDELDDSDEVEPEELETDEDA